MPELRPPVRVLGRIVTAEPATELPRFHVVVRDRADGTIVGEGPTLVDGRFAVVLAVDDLDGDRVRAVVTILDGEGSALAESEVEAAPDRPAVVDLDVPDARSRPPAAWFAGPPLLVDAAAADVLRARVRDLEADGEVPAGSAAHLDVALSPLERLGALRDDALAALAGDGAAADRFRASLLGWSAALAPDDDTTGDDGVDVPVVEPVGVRVRGGADADDVVGTAPTVVDEDGLLPLAAAAVHVGADADEIQRLSDGIAAAAWSRQWVRLVALAAGGPDPGPMRTLMGGAPGLPSGGLGGGGLGGGGLGGGGLGGGGLGGGGLGGGGVGGGPVDPGDLVPGWAKVGGRRIKFKVSPVVADLVPAFRNPLNLPPSAAQRCLAGAMVDVAMLRNSLPSYRIETIHPADACAGDFVTLAGRDFGPAAGDVRFTAAAAPAPLVSWTDTRIVAVVPEDAAPGPVELRILAVVLRRCNRDFPVFRNGDSAVDFAGGDPKILGLWVDGQAGDVVVNPGAVVGVTVGTTEAPGVTLTVSVTGPAGAVFSSGPLPGGYHMLSFTAPPAGSGPVDLTLRVDASGACRTTTRTMTVTVALQPRLEIFQAEITQAIQRLDNSVRLAAHRTTMLRLYVGHGLPPSYSYTAAWSSLPNITGSVTIRRAGQVVAVVQPSPAAMTTTFFFQPMGRANLALSLNFWLPPGVLDGELTFEARIRLDPLPHGVRPGGHTVANRTVTARFDRTRRIPIVMVLVRDDQASPPLPAPSSGRWNKAAVSALRRLPLADDGFEYRIAAGGPVLASTNDLSKDEGWADLLDDLDDLAEDTVNGGSLRWAAIVPQAPAGYPARSLNGRGGANRMAAQSGLVATWSHELCHTFGVDHAGCPVGTGAPADVDPTLSPWLEDWGIDLDPVNLRVFADGPGGTNDLMSYCGGEDRWTSISLWNKLFGVMQE